jgi:ATP-binding cassette subfamily F protein uup
MALVTLRDLSIGYRGPPLLDGVSCNIEAGQRIGLLGRNGSGKTTLMRILCGQVEPDDGQVIFAAGTRVSLLPQEVPRNWRGSVFETVAQGLRPEQHLMSSPPDDAHSATAAPEDSESDWRWQQRVDDIVSRMGLDPELPFPTLSSGMKRRVLLARTLVSGPDLLLLDEPTNHLDMESIEWLEEFLARFRSTLIFVTHDRMFLRKLAERILELDRGRLFDWSCDYDTFLRRKAAALAAEEKQNALFDKRLAKEEAWIRQGIKARRTRNEGRARALSRMRQERARRRAVDPKVRLEIHQGRPSGNLVADLEEVSFAFGDHPIVNDFSTTIMRGDKVGIIGPNGAGKTTLLSILLGQLPPQRGAVRRGSHLQIAYFDQLRQQLDENRSVHENVGDGYDSVGAGNKVQHIIGYLQGFLFTPERSRTLVRFLSGGERNRVLLARLFAKPANVIVLDEPTNDLDTETLELLEERLVQFEGTVLLVSHDREFLNNVATSTIVFEGGEVKEYVGGYDDWLRQRPDRSTGRSDHRKPSSKTAASKGGQASTDSTPKAKASSLKSTERRRRTYKEQQELAGLPARIEQWEAEVADLHHAMAQAKFYQQPGSQIAEQQSRLKNLEGQLAAAYERWEELELLSG